MARRCTVSTSRQPGRFRRSRPVGKPPELSKDEPGDGGIGAFGQGDAEIGQVVDGKDPGRTIDPSGWRWMP